MKVYHLQGFGIDATSGNKADVIIADRFDELARQAYAADTAIPVCVFIDNLTLGQLKVSFYYPHRQSPLCLHGSLAAAKVYFDIFPNETELQLISSFGKQIRVSKNEYNEIYLQAKADFVQPANEYFLQISNFLGCDEQQIIGELVISSVGSPKLLVQLVDVDCLFSLQPDLTAIVEWGKIQQINGIYAYSNSNGIINGRNFNHLESGLEDSATGVAVGALSLYLQQDIKVHQGWNLGNKCLIIAKYLSADEIIISGNVTYLL